MPKVRLPDEAAGIGGIVEALISGYDQFDIVAVKCTRAEAIPIYVLL